MRKPVRTAKKKTRSKTLVKSRLKRSPNWRSALLTTDEAGAAVKMSGERVRQLTKLGWIKKAGPNSYRLGDLIDGYVSYRDDQSKKIDADSEQSKLAAARRGEIEQRMAREDGKLIPIEEVQAGIADILGTYRAELSGVAAASTRDLDARAAIESNLNGAIERCRSRFEAMEGDLRAGREVKLDGEEADN